MFNIIPLVLILFSLGIIILIVVRKFSVLANLDIDTIQAEKEAKFKEQIISNRLKRGFVKWSSRGKRATLPVKNGIGNLFKWSHQKLVEVKKSYTSEEKVEPADIEARTERLFSEAEDLIKSENYSEAEQKYIDIIGLDPKNIKAFRRLGKLYFEEKNFGEAIQTFEHALKLLDDTENVTGVQATDDSLNEGETKLATQSASIHFNIALTQKATQEIDQAIAAIKKALRLEPNNPRYLDTMLELCIMNKDKILALDAYDKLEKVNPDNKKLEDFKEQIDGI
jgi:tetratricopeptide (TPR) repeat protein